MSDIVATVNGAPIDAKAVQAAMQGLAQEQFHTTVAELPTVEHARLREMALERLIARELIYQAALASGVVASQEDVQAEKSRIVRMAGNPKNFWARLAERGMDEKAFERMVRKDVTVDLMSARKLAELPEPGAEEVEMFFRRYPDQLRRPERVRVAHILFPVDPQQPKQAIDQANEIRARAETEDFSALARQYSACPSAPGGGDLGFVRREDLDETFADAVFNQATGEISGPIKTPFGIHLAKVLERDKPGPPTLEEARPGILAVLKRMAGARLMEQWVDELRSQAKIEVFPSS